MSDQSAPNQATPEQRRARLDAAHADLFTLSQEALRTCFKECRCTDFIPDGKPVPNDAYVCFRCRFKRAISKIAEAVQ